MFAFYWLMAPVFLALRGPGALRVLATAPRETSVVFAVLIARVFIREAASRKIWLACFVVAGGAMRLGL